MTKSVSRLRRVVREYDEAVRRGSQQLPVGTAGDDLPGRDRIARSPGSLKSVALSLAEDDIHHPNDSLGRDLRRRSVNQTEMRQGIDDGRIGDFGGLRILVRAAFQGDGVASREAHIFGGADPFGNRLARMAEPLTLREEAAIDIEPTVDDDRGAEPCGEGALRGGMAERLDRTRIVEGAGKNERLALTPERVDVEQDIMLPQQGAETVADPVLVILRDGLFAQVPVQVPVALSRALALGLHVRDRQEGDLAPADHGAARTVSAIARRIASGPEFSLPWTAPTTISFGPGSRPMKRTASTGVSGSTRSRSRSPRRRCRSPSRAQAPHQSGILSPATPMQPAVPLLSRAAWMKIALPRPGSDRRR